MEEEKQGNRGRKTEEEKEKNRGREKNTERETQWRKALKGGKLMVRG